LLWRTWSLSPGKGDLFELAKRGHFHVFYPTQLKFGYKTALGKFQAHAWLEYNGLPLTVNAKVAEEYLSFAAPLIK